MKTFQIFVFTIICYYSTFAQSGEKLGNVSTKANNDNPCANNSNKTCENTKGYFMASQYGYGENESFAQRSAEAKVKASLGEVFGIQLKTVIVNYMNRNDKGKTFSKEEFTAIDTVLSSNTIFGFEKYCQSFSTSIDENNKKIITSNYCGRIPIKLNINMLGQQLLSAGISKKRVNKIIEIFYEEFGIPFEKVGFFNYVPSGGYIRKKEYWKVAGFWFLEGAAIVGGTYFYNQKEDYRQQLTLQTTNQTIRNQIEGDERKAALRSISFFSAGVIIYALATRDGFPKKIATGFTYNQNIKLKPYFATSHSGLSFLVTLNR